MCGDSSRTFCCFVVTRFPHIKCLPRSPLSLPWRLPSRESSFDAMRNVIVTGGSRGLGLGIARKLVTAGYRVIAIARKESEQLASVMRELGEADQSPLLFRPFDLGNLAGIPPLVKGLRKEFGSIYGLVNNAGLGTSGVLAT